MAVEPARASLIDGKAFEAENTVPGFASPVTYNADSGVLLLGPPAVFTADNVDKFDF